MPPFAGCGRSRRSLRGRRAEGMGGVSGATVFCVRGGWARDGESWRCGGRGGGGRWGSGWSSALCQPPSCDLALRWGRDPARGAEGGDGEGFADLASAVSDASRSAAPLPVPLTRACSARPAKEAIRRRQSAPSSGRSPRRLASAVEPVPGTAESSWARSASAGLAAIPRSLSAMCRSRSAIVVSISLRIAGWPALWRRAFSALRISTDCLRRRRKSARRPRSGAGGAVASRGSIRPISARMRASTRSVLASAPRARANARAGREMTRAKRTPGPASASMGGRLPPQPRRRQVRRHARRRPIARCLLERSRFSPSLRTAERAYRSSRGRGRSR